MKMKAVNNRSDQNVRMVLVVLASSTALLLAMIIVFLFGESWPLFAHIWNDGQWGDLLQNNGWYPLEGHFGMMPMILSSLAVTVGALVVALPLGLGSAIFLQFYATAVLAKGFGTLLNLLAGIPSVVFGLWGLTRLVPMIAQWQPPGASLLAAVLVLSLMILPTIALTSSAALSGVPSDITAGGKALGLRRMTRIVHISLPAARSGIISGALLATARALGETMAVLMVAGNVVQNPSGLFEPVRVLTANIALEMAYAMDVHRASLFASGLLLTALVWFLSWGAHRMTKSQVKEHSHG